MRLKYLDKDEPAASVSSMISEVLEMRENNNPHSLLHLQEMILKFVKYGKFLNVRFQHMKIVWKLIIQMTISWMEWMTIERKWIITLIVIQD